LEAHNHDHNHCTLITEQVGMLVVDCNQELKAFCVIGQVDHCLGHSSSFNLPFKTYSESEKLAAEWRGKALTADLAKTN